MRPTLLITGGLGNLGSWLTSYFVKQQYEVSVFTHRQREVLTDLPFSLILGDLRDENSCLKTLGNKHFDYIIHAGSANDYFEADYAKNALLTNALGTRNILEVMKEKPIRHFLYLSTFQVYGCHCGHITEKTPVAPSNDYAISHYFAEKYVEQYHRQYHLPYSIIRLTNSYGAPLDIQSSKWYLILNDLSRMAYEKQEIRLRSNGKAQRDFIWMGDVCAIFKQLLQQPSPPNCILNLGSGKSTTLLAVAEQVREAFANYSGKRIPITINEDDHSSHDQALNVSIEAIRQYVKWQKKDYFKKEALKIFELLASQQRIKE